MNLFFDSVSTQDSVSFFKNLFQKRFFSKSAESCFVSFNFELQNFKQKSDESLAVYYKRIFCMMQRISAKNRPVLEIETFSFLKSAMLDNVLKSFLKRLFDEDVRKKIIKILISFDKSFREMYVVAKKIRRTKQKFQKFQKKENQFKALNFYRNIVEKNMSSEQIQVLMVSYTNQHASFYFFRSEQLFLPVFLSPVPPPEPSPYVGLSYQYENQSNLSFFNQYFIFPGQTFQNQQFHDQIFAEYPQPFLHQNKEQLSKIQNQDQTFQSSQHFQKSNQSYQRSSSQSLQPGPISYNHYQPQSFQHLISSA